MAISYKPDIYHHVTPYVVTVNASDVIEFLENVFGARPREIMRTPDGKIGHAELFIGDSIVMIADENEMQKAMPSRMFIYVEDVDSVYKRGIAMGATSLREPTDMFYGDRSAGLADRSGNQWWGSTHTEDVPEDELKRRAEKEVEQMSSS